jgi:hypothetical protein
MHHCDGSIARTHLENVSTCFVGKYTFQHVGSRHFRVFCRSQTTEGTTASRFLRCQSESTNATLPHSNSKGTQFKARISQLLVSSGTFHVGFLRHGSPHMSFVFSNSTFRPQNASKGCGLALRIQYKSFPKHYENINFCKTSRGFSCSKISPKMKSYETELFFYVQFSSNKPFPFQWLTAFVPNWESLYFYFTHALFTDWHRIFHIARVWTARRLHKYLTPSFRQT